MLVYALSSYQAIMPQINIGGDLVLSLNGDGWGVVSVVAIVAFTVGKLLK